MQGHVSSRHLHLVTCFNDLFLVATTRFPIIQFATRECGLKLFVGQSTEVYSDIQNSCLILARPKFRLDRGCWLFHARGCLLVKSCLPKT
jgi:hypothetical protein